MIIRMSFFVAVIALIGCTESKAEPAPKTVAKRVRSEVVSKDSVPGTPAGEPTPTAVERKSEGDDKPVEEKPKTPEKRDSENKTTEDVKDPAPEPAMTTDGGLVLHQLTAAKGVEKRTPVDAGDTFVLGEFERIYAFLKLENSSGAEDEVTVSWSRDGGRERGKATIKVGVSKRWRTWAYTRTVKAPGKWEIIVRNRAGEVIGRTPFEIVE